jgi:peptide/nickel transport system substrate-binding protein
METSPSLGQTPESTGRLSRRQFVTLMAGASAAVAVAACQPAAPPAAPQPSGGQAPAASTSGSTATLRIATAQEPGVLMGGRGVTSAYAFYTIQLYDTLYAQAADLSRQPAAALSSSVSDDKLTITFKLRPGVKFVDGTPLTSRDVKFSYDYILDPANNYNTRSNYSTIIKSIDAPDDQTVVFNMTGPDASYLTDLSTPILPAEYFQKVGWEGFNQKPVGSGPYSLVEYKLHETMTLQANPNYWGTPPAIKNIHIQYVPDVSTRIALLKTGNVNAIDGVQPQQIADLQATSGIRVMSVPNNETNAILFNTKSPISPNPFKDTNVRIALNYAVDKEAIIDSIMLKTVTPEVTNLVSSSPIGRATELKPYPYDPTKAKQMLAQAGHANGIPGEWELSYPNGRFVLADQVLQAVAANLKDVGVTVRVVPEDIARWGQRMQAQDGSEVFPMSFTQAGSNTGEPYVNYRGFLDSRVSNSHYANPKLDALLDQSRAVFDMKERDELFKNVERLIYNDPPYIFLYEGSNTFAVDAKVKWQAPKGWTFYRFWEMQLQ